MRKMLVAMAKDIRVLLIKLADRLHNMRTIASLPEAKQLADRPGDPRHLRAARAPARHRRVKWQLEDLAFAVVHPKRYAEIEQLVATQAPEREDVPRRPCSARSASGSPSCTSTPRSRGRPKHYWSIYEKMVVKNKEFDEVQDLVGVRVVVETVKDCYAALGSIHAWWRPVQGRFKDYIAMPKFNLYQSLHTTVVGPGRAAGRGADPDRGDAPAGRVRHRRALGLQGGDESAKSANDSGVAAAPGRLAAGDRGPRAVHAVLKVDLEQ